MVAPRPPRGLRRSSTSLRPRCTTRTRTRSARALRRFFDSGVSAERSYVDGAESEAALWKAGARYAQGELALALATGQRRWIPYTAVYELAKFAGLQLGRRHALLPAAVKMRMSAYPEHWR